MRRKLMKEIQHLARADRLLVISLASINFAIAYAIIKRANRADDK